MKLNVSSTLKHIIFIWFISGKLVLWSYYNNSFGKLNVVTSIPITMTVTAVTIVFIMLVMVKVMMVMVVLMILMIVIMEMVRDDYGDGVDNGDKYGNGDGVDNGDNLLW